MRRCRGFRSERAFLCVLFACSVASMWWCAASAQANDFEDFGAARTAYDAQDYRRAAALFEALAGGDTPALTNKSLVLESKKYLAASYLFLKKVSSAELEFERLLRLDRDYQLDPLGFPEEVQRLFARVKTRIEAERQVAEDARRQQEERERERQTQHVIDQRARWARLSAMAQNETVHEVRSRWLALMPFGLGQFQNGNQSLGAVLAVSEGALLAVGIVTWAVHEDLSGTTPRDSDREAFKLSERVSRYTNQVSMLLFGVLAISGVIDAQVRFRSNQDYERKRALPPDLYGGPEVSIGPGALSLRLRF